MNTQHFSICPTLQDLTQEYCTDYRHTLDNVLLVAMQHVLHTTVEMLMVMQQCGLKHAVIGGKSYSTHQESACAIEALGFDYINDGHQLGFGRFDDCMSHVVHRIWARAQEKMQQQAFETIIVLDDGADLLRATPGIFFNQTQRHHRFKKIIGIEQTRGGSNHPLFKGLPFPVVNVAGAFIKNKLEYQQVSKIIADKTQQLIQQTIAKKLGHKPTIGIIGYGTMGRAIAQQFHQLNFPVIAYDKNSQKRNNNDPLVMQYEYADILISNADVIFGCTGADSTRKKPNLAALLYSRQPKWLISTGSKDHEFNTLLRTIQNEACVLGYAPNPLKTIQYENHVGAVIEILRGGFPLNFTNDAHSVEPQFIWPTRAALLLACLSISQVNHTTYKKMMRNTKTFMLPVEAQYCILQKYAELNPFCEKGQIHKLLRLPKADVFEMIKQTSEGEPIHFKQTKTKSTPLLREPHESISTH